MPAIIPPDIAHPNEPGRGHAPSWSASSGPFLTEEHGHIFETTKNLPGWQDIADSEKLYEIAFHNGAVILEIGIFGGRSAVVELRGAVAGAAKKNLPPPQYYGLDVEVSAISRGFTTINDAGLLEHAVLFHGDLAKFLSQIPITPTMVFVDGDHSYAGCWRDLFLLSSRLVAGTPVLCHDYGWIDGVRRAVDEAVRSGAYERLGCFASSILLRATGKVCPGRPTEPRGLSAGAFRMLRERLLARYFSATDPKARGGSFSTPSRDLTEPLRCEFLGLDGEPDAPRSWPHAPLGREANPGEILPKLTVITPTLNHERHLDESLLSVFHQGYPNLEHFVVDLGSTDGTVGIAKKSRERFGNLLLGDPTRHGAEALREAVTSAAGERIVWLPGDEVLEPGLLWTVGRALQRKDQPATGTRHAIEELLPQGSASAAGRVFHRDELPMRRTPQDPGEVYRLAAAHGAVILGVGLVGMRSGLLELRGALAAAKDRGLPPPQFYGVDPNPAIIEACRDSLHRAGLSSYALLYSGTLAQFRRELPIEPTLVLIDGMYGYRNCRSLLLALHGELFPGTPIVVRNYGRGGRLRPVVDELLSSGSFGRIGASGGLLITCGESREGTPGGNAGFTGRGLPAEQFEVARAAMFARRGTDEARVLDPVSHESRRRLQTSSTRRQFSGRAGWPFAPVDAQPLPDSLPGGKPWPRISIVTPSFNQGRYIEETILSVRNQGYPNVEHIIMDGGSTDETLAIIDRYRDGFAHAISQKDKGQSDAINRGFRLATGDILTWLNSDDQLAPGALAAVAMAFHHSGADLVAGECHVHRDSKVESRHLTACKDGPLPLEDLLDIDGCWLEGQFFYQPEVMFTRRLWDRAGGHVREDLYHSMDYEMWLRMAAAGAKLHVIGRPVALFRAHPEQKTAGDVVGGFRTELPKARDAFLAERGRTFTAPARRPRKDRLRIVLFNDLGFAYGAGIAHRRLAEAFLQAGHDVIPIAASLTDYHHSTPRAAIQDSLEQISAAGPDLVVVGNMHGARLDPALLGAIASRFVTAFVMHDLWLLTGRCAYTGECRNYLKRCGPACHCPPGHPDVPGDLIGPAWDTKRRVLGGSPNLGVWANSTWARDRAMEALGHIGQLAGPEPAVITFGFELDVLRPRDKSVCRDLLGLPQDKFIIMSSASSLADPRKGLKHLADALTLLQIKDSLVACVGWFGQDEKPPIPGMRAMGYERDPKRLAMLYSAADLFVGPSLEEAFGQVYIEAAACGTPSVGYPVGGKPEAIFDGVSGRLTKRVSPDSLADAIDELYHDRRLRENMGRWGRLWVENQWSMSASYRRLFAVMHEQGWAEGLGLGRRLGLVVKPRPVPEPTVLAPTMPAWRNVSGFDAWEGPYPDRGIGRCRWALGPVATFEIESRRDEAATIYIAGRCFAEGQRIRLVQGGTEVGERDFGVSDLRSRTDSVISFQVHLRRGANRFELHFWKWATTGRPMALLVTNITAIGAGDVARTEMMVEGKPPAKVHA